MKDAPKLPMSTGKKVCIGCTVGIAVFAAVMIPVGLLVIAPKMAQSAIDQSVFHLTNSTVYGVPLNEVDGYNSFNGWATQNLIVHSDFFLGGRLHEANVSMIINMPNATATLEEGGFTPGEVGWFTMPETTISKGDTVINFTAPIHFNSTADGGHRFVFWGFYVLLSGVVYVDIVAKPKLTALGFITVETTLKKTLACNCIQGTDNCNNFMKSNVSSPGVRPNATWQNDDSFFQPLPDNMTGMPTKDWSNSSIGWAPKVSIFCEPLGTDVYNGSANMPIVTTTTTTTSEGEEMAPLSRGVFTV